MNLTLSKQSSDYQLIGSFKTQLALDNVDPVDISVMAAVRNSGQDTTLHFSGSTTSNIAVPGLSCFSIKPMNLSASLSLRPSFVINDLDLAGGAEGCGLGSADASFKYDSASQLTLFAMQINPDLPEPFIPGSSATITISKQGDISGLSARFDCGISLPQEVLVNPLGISIGIFVSKDVSQTTSMTISGDMTTPVAFSSFPSFSINSLRVYGSFTLSPTKALTALNMTGSFSIASQAAEGAFVYDPVSKSIGLLVTMPTLSLQVFQLKQLDGLSYFNPPVYVCTHIHV